MIIPGRILLRMKNVSHQSCKKNKNIYFVFNTFQPLTPPPKIVPLMGYVDKYHTARQATHVDIMLHRKDVLCMPDN